MCKSVDHPRSAIFGISSVLKFGLDPTYSFGDIAIFIFCRFGLKLPIHAHFWFFWGIFPPSMVTHRSNPQKDHPCAETRRLSHKAWKSVQRFDLGAGSRKKGKDRTGQDSQKKSQRGNISPIWGEAPTVPIETKICTVGHHADVITHAKFQGDIFRGYDF